MPCVPVLIACDALAAYRFIYAPPRCRSLQYRSTFFPLSVSLLTDLTYSVFDRAGLASFESKANAFSLARDACSPFLLLFSVYLQFFHRLAYNGWGDRTDMV